MKIIFLSIFLNLNLILHLNSPKIIFGVKTCSYSIDTIRLDILEKDKFDGSNLIDFSNENKKKYGKINKLYTYHFKYVGDIEMDEGSFERFDFIITNDRLKREYLFKNIFGSWFIEKSIENEYLTIPIKSKVFERLSIADLFLISPQKNDPIIIDSNIFNFTNSPFFNLRGKDYCIYLNDNKITIYSIDSGSKTVVSVVKMNVNFSAQNLRLKIISIKGNKLKLKLTIKNLDNEAVFSLFFDLDVSPILHA
jgi:hypothetical protein